MLSIYIYWISLIYAFVYAIFYARLFLKCVTLRSLYMCILPYFYIFYCHMLSGKFAVTSNFIWLFYLAGKPLSNFSDHIFFTCSNIGYTDMVCTVAEMKIETYDL